MFNVRLFSEIGERFKIHLYPQILIQRYFEYQKLMLNPEMHEVTYK